jgi:protocatechuate 3,4-dioxygenase beta subunit
MRFLAVVMSVVLFASPQGRDGGVVVQTGTAVISGTVQTGDTTASAARRVTLTLTGERSGVRLVAVSDDGGQFAFTGLPPDRYSVLAEKGGYLSMRYGSRRAGGSGTPVVVAEGQRVAIAMTMVKGSVLTGTVRDELGQPLPAVTVTALRFAVAPSTGERGPQDASMGSSAAFPSYFPDSFPGTATTDDRGMYRIYGLAPGDYVVSASVRPPRGGSPMTSTDVHQVSVADVQRAQLLLRASGSGMPVSSTPRGDRVDTARVDYAPVYHPAAIAAADATVITLGQSEERFAIDVQVRLVRTTRITGVALSMDGTPVVGAQISLMNPTPGETGAIRITRSDGDGAFVIAGVNPGRYPLRGHLNAAALFGVVEVEAAGRDVSTSLILAPASKVSGRFVFDGVSKPPDVKTFGLLAWPWVLGGSSLKREPDGRFTVSELPPGKYRLRVTGSSAGWVLRSTMVNGVDASDIPFEVKQGENIEGAVITFTDRGAEVSGRFLDATGRPAPEYQLVVFSADRRYWVPQTRRTQQVRPDVSGVFVARDLPAGDYLISAVTDLEDGQWHDPAFLATLAASSPIRITLAEGDRKVQDIRVGGRY